MFKKKPAPNTRPVITKVSVKVPFDSLSERFVNLIKQDQINQAKAIIDITDPKDYGQILAIACQYGMLEIVKELADKVNNSYYNLLDPIDSAIKYNQDEVALWLIAKEVKGYTLAFNLRSAFYKKNLPIMHALLETGIKIFGKEYWNANNASIETFLLQKASEEYIQLLIDFGLEIESIILTISELLNEFNKEYSYYLINKFHTCNKQDLLNIARTIVLKLKPEERVKVISAVLPSCDDSELKAFLQKQFENLEGLDLSMLAVLQQPELVTKLLARGDNPNRKYNGKKPIEALIKQYKETQILNIDILKLLIKHGLNINVSNGSDTLLHYILREKQGNVGCLDTLLEILYNTELDLTIKDEQGKTLEDLANIGGHYLNKWKGFFKKYKALHEVEFISSIQAFSQAVITSKEQLIGKLPRHIAFYKILPFVGRNLLHKNQQVVLNKAQHIFTATETEVYLNNILKTIFDKDELTSNPRVFKHNDELPVTDRFTTNAEALTVLNHMRKGLEEGNYIILDRFTNRELDLLIESLAPELAYAFARAKLKRNEQAEVIKLLALVPTSYSAYDWSVTKRVELYCTHNYDNSEIGKARLYQNLQYQLEQYLAGKSEERLEFIKQCFQYIDRAEKFQERINLHKDNALARLNDYAFGRVSDDFEAIKEQFDIINESAFFANERNQLESYFNEQLLDAQKGQDCQKMLMVDSAFSRIKREKEFEKIKAENVNILRQQVKSLLEIDKGKAQGSEIKIIEEVYRYRVWLLYLDQDLFDWLLGYTIRCNYKIITDYAIQMLYFAGRLIHEKIITYEFKPYTTSVIKYTTLAYAVIYDRFELVQKMLAYNLTMPEEDFARAITCAIDSEPEKIEMLKLLLQYPIDIKSLQKYLNTTFEVAIILNKFASLRLLLKAGFDVNYVSDDLAYRRVTMSYLNSAIFRKKYEAAEVLIQHGVNVNRLDDLGKLPIILAAQASDFKFLDLLLTTPNIDVNKQNASGYTALYYAVDTNDCHKVESLLNHGASVTKAEEIGVKLASIAVTKGNDDMLELLLPHTINIDAQDGNNLWHCLLGPRNIVRPAAEYKKIFNRLANTYATKEYINKKNKLGATPLHYAARYNHYEEVKRLIELGADINAVDNDGNTPAHLAAAYGHTDVLIELINKKTDMAFANQDKKRPFDLFPAKLASEKVRVNKVLFNSNMHLLCKILDEAIFSYLKAPEKRLPGLIEVFEFHGSAGDIRACNLLNQLRAAKNIESLLTVLKNHLARDERHRLLFWHAKGGNLFNHSLDTYLLKAIAGNETLARCFLGQDNQKYSLENEVHRRKFRDALIMKLGSILDEHKNEQAHPIVKTYK